MCANNSKPHHKHDCNSCIFLGNFEDKFGVYDLYYHAKQDISGRPTVIARYGIDGAYLSGMTFGYHARNDMNDPIGEAYRRAVEKGYVNPNLIPI